MGQTAVNSEELFKQVTADLIVSIEEGAGDWKMPWRCLGQTGAPRSIDGRSYRGVNALILAIRGADRGWSSATWATFEAWKRRGQPVRRGERGTQIVVWRTSTNDDLRTDPDAGTKPAKVFARTHTVFAAEQVEYGRAEPTRASTTSNVAGRIAAAAAHLDSVRASIVFGGDNAFYSPASDRIHLPSPDQFERFVDYLTTSAHEHIHWTGHASRLDRDLTGRFGSAAYGAEELIAELGAAFWSAKFRLDQVSRLDHAAYLGDWLNILRTDSRAIVAVCSQAQRAIDHLDHAASADGAPNSHDGFVYAANDFNAIDASLTNSPPPG